MSDKYLMNELRALVDLRDRTLQKSRIAFGLRVGAIARGTDLDAQDAPAARLYGDEAADSLAEQGLEAVPDSGSLLFEKYALRFKLLEQEADADIRAMVRTLPIVEEMVKVRGVGLLLAAKVVAMIDIERSDTVSALWRYSGWAVIDGKRERPVKGEKLHYNIRLKTTCYLVASSFLRSGSPYRRLYDESRAKYEANRPDWTKAHCHQAAMRVMVKVWLSHVWEVWRKLEGLPTRDIYIVAQEGSMHKAYAPAEFGWTFDGLPRQAPTREQVAAVFTPEVEPQAVKPKRKYTKRAKPITDSNPSNTSEAVSRVSPDGQERAEPAE